MNLYLFVLVSRYMNLYLFVLVSRYMNLYLFVLVSRYMNPVKCYECVSRSNYFDNYCGDPFNANHPKMNTSVCTGQCVKWVRLERVGKLFYSNIHQVGY